MKSKDKGTSVEISRLWVLWQIIKLYFNGKTSRRKPKERSTAA